MSNKISDLQNSKKRQNKYLLVAISFVFLSIISLLLYSTIFKEEAPKKQPVSIFFVDINEDKVKSLNVTPDYLVQGFEVIRKDGSKYLVDGPYLEMPQVKSLSEKGVTIDYLSAKTDYRALPSYIMLGIFSIFILMSLGQSLGVSFMKASTRSNIKFDDVAGNEEAKHAMLEVVDYLKAPAGFEEFGAKFPKGIIMDGPPGTGKTLLAKAIAGEAGANFLAVSGSDFSSMFVGVSGMKIRGMFARARRLAPCVMFIDEIDAIGGHRLSEGSATAREMGNTLNSLLVQMDGFEANSGVVVIAATNRIELLDRALLRSGRFDRHIHVQLPTLPEREDILKIHAKSIKISEDFDFNAVAKVCIGMSGADLSNVMNQAALIAVREGASYVNTVHAQKGRDRVIMGDARHSQAKAMTPATKKILAIHETGHALVGMVYGPEKVSRISIIPRGQSLGQTMLNPAEDIMVHERNHLLSKIRLLLGGRAAELVIGGTETTGASDDLNRASQLSMDIVSRYGMGEEGYLLTLSEKTSDSFKRELENGANKIMEACLRDACDTILSHREIFEEIVNVLIEIEEIDEEGVRYYEKKVQKNIIEMKKHTKLLDDQAIEASTTPT